jgi:hypothetical protein
VHCDAVYSGINVRSSGEACCLHREGRWKKNLSDSSTFMVETASLSETSMHLYQIILASHCGRQLYFSLYFKVVWRWSLLNVIYFLFFYVTVFALPRCCAVNVSKAWTLAFSILVSFYFIKTTAIRKLSFSIMCIKVFVTSFCTCLPNRTTLLSWESQMTYISVSLFRWKEFKEIQNILNLTPLAQSFLRS